MARWNEGLGLYGPRAQSAPTVPARVQHAPPPRARSTSPTQRRTNPQEAAPQEIELTVSAIPSYSTLQIAIARICSDLINAIKLNQASSMADETTVRGLASSITDNYGTKGAIEAIKILTFMSRYYSTLAKHVDPQDSQALTTSANFYHRKAQGHLTRLQSQAAANPDATNDAIAASHGRQRNGLFETVEDVATWVEKRAGKHLPNKKTLPQEHPTSSATPTSSAG